MATFRVEIDGGIETVTARTEKEAIRKAARKQGNSKSIGTTFGPKVKIKKIKEGTETTSYIDSKKMSEYQKFAKANKIDDDSVRMACDNPNHPETKRMMTQKKFATAVKMYKAAKGKKMNEKYSPKEIKMAVGVASDKRYAGGNMTGAVKAIEKIKKGLSSDPQVAAVLKRQNEGKMKSFDQLMVELSEGKAANPAQQAAIAIAKKEKEKSVKERTEANELDEAQKLFMFTSKAEAQKKAKQIGGKVLELKRAMDGNMFAVIHKDLTKKAFKEGIVGNLVKKTAKAAGGAVVNRLTTSGRAKIAQKKLDKHKTKMDQKSDIAQANAAGKSAFGFTQKQRAANAKKKLDKIAKKKSDQETIQRAKDLKKKPPVTAGMEYEGKKMDSAAMKRAMDAFKKRGGKIKKVAPGKAAGYHGKDDPGADVQGMMDRGDTKGFNRKKKVKSMGK